MRAVADLGQRGRNRRVGGLDGVRGLAIVAVLGYHAFPDAVPGGFLGVEMFFVLSGLLIASPLLREQCDTGRLDMPHYARRRVARVLPALVFLLLGVVLLGRFVVPEDAHRVPGDVLASLAGVTNWHLIQDGSSYFRDLGRPSMVRHLWSLAIEIQFYAVCPLVVWFLARRRPRVGLWCLIAAIATSAVAMALLAGGGDSSRAYFGTEARIGALLTGVLLAFLLPSPGVSREKRHVIPARALALGGAGLLATLLFGVHDGSRFLYPGGFLLCRLATIALIVAALRPGGGPAALRSAPLRWFGQRSYGIYLWHWPLLVVMRPGVDVAWPPWVTGVIAIAGACVLGELSYRFVELPFLVQARSGRPIRIPTPARWVTVGMAMMSVAVMTTLLPSNDPIASSLELGAQVVSAQETPLPAPPVTALAPDEATPTRALSITAVGDSVMLGAAGALHAHLGATGYVDAVVSRQFTEGVRRLRQLRDRGQLGEVVVVHLGTNGPPSAADVDRLMDAVAGVRHVRFVNVRVNRRWQDATNQTLADAVNRYAPRAQLVDWHARSEGHLDWFLSDGTHLRPPGAEAYAELIALSLPQPPIAPKTAMLTRTAGTSVG